MSNKQISSSRTAAKSKLNLASELYALGSKSGTGRTDDAKPGKNPSDRKRDAAAAGASNLPATKKTKLGIGSLPSTSSRSSSEGTASSSTSMEYWEQTIIECEAVDLIQSVMTAIDQQDSDTIIGLICGAIKLYSSARTKPDNLLCLNLVYLSKLRPHIFCNETVTQALVSILKRDTQNAFKGKNNPSVHVLTCNLLARGHYDKKQWPDIFMKIYIEDAINDRVWVDNEDCSVFVENIVSSFGTKIPPKSMLQPELNALASNKETPGNIDDESMDSLPSGDSVRSGADLSIGENSSLTSKYSQNMANVEKIVLDAIKEQLNRRQGPDAVTRNFLKFLSTVTGLQEVRALCVTRLELWIHNGKLMKPAQELLTYLCYNISASVVKDQEVLSNLVKIRLKTKPLINIFMSCFKEMINLQPEILSTLLKYVVQNELSNTRNPNNMGMLGNMFQVKSDASAKHLAEIYQEFLLQKEDCLRTLKVFLRELVKMLRYDINLSVFVKAFINIRPEIATQIQASEFRDRIFSHMIDLICLCMFLSVSPHVKDAIMSIRTGRDMKDSPVLYSYYAQMSQMQSDILTFMLEVVPNVIQPSPNDYAALLHKVLLLDAPELYCKGDTWPQDGEKTFFVRATSDIPLHQDSILKLILIGIHKDIHFSVPDTMEMVDQLVRRAGALKVVNYPPLEANKIDIIDFLFSMSEYHHPDNIQLPVGYEPPKLAISSLYWKTWIILLILSAHNTATFGSFCWEHYPMLRNLIEMCITNQFIQAKQLEEELQITAIEKQQILEFETHLAAATSKVMITEQTSLLLSQVMLMDPMGVPRRPPLHVLEQLQTLNKTHKLGHLLCRSRKPDLLVDIIQRQGTSQSMPWLADLVQNSEGDFNHLPVQCLCEFLLSTPLGSNTPREQELMIYLQNLLVGEQVEHQISCEVIEYFLRRLSSTSRQSRYAAIRALKLLLKIFEKEEEAGLLDSNDAEWLLRYLPLVPHFPFVRPTVIVQLRAACQVENNSELIMAYIQFIAAHTLQDGVSEMFEHVMDMSQLIVERSTVFSQIVPAPNELHENKYQTLNCLFVMFNNFFVKLRESKSQTFAEYPELLLVHFSDATQCSIHLSIIQAFVILLTYSAPLPAAETILDYWFPLNSPPPQAFTMDTSEPVQILPDWLKLKMIRSNVERLVDAALQDLTPDQIVLFVQNFGTPVNSMSKLLALLDRAVIEQCETVNAAILNKPYLAQLIEIQQVRGAKNGHISVQALDLHDPIVADTPKPIQVKPVDEWVLNLKHGTQVQKQEKSSTTKQSKEVEEVLEAILTRPVMNKVMQHKFRKLIQQLSIKQLKNQPKLSTSAEFIITKVVQHFGKLMKTQQAAYIFRNIVQNPTTCTFFRTFFSIVLEKPELIMVQVQLVDELLKYMNPTQHSVLLQIVMNKKKALGSRTDSSKKFGCSSQMERKEALMKIFQNSGIPQKLALQEVNQRTDASKLITALTMGLRELEPDIKKESNVQSTSFLDTRGLLVDWLAEADSEMIQTNHELQMNLLFGENKHSFRPYLLSLSHQSSWSTMAKVVESLLDEYNEKYDSSYVLDFIDALIRNPKLWQGRDRAVPKHEQLEYILELNENQIKSMVNYILHENLKIVQQKPSLNARIHLLLHCSDPNRIDFIKLINFVDQKHDPSVTVTKKMFLQHLYLNMPPIKFLPVQLEGVFDANLRQLNGCVADQFSHSIITTINSLANPKEWQVMSQDMELIVRKLAACHPALLLRQIMVLTGLLQGRAHMDMLVLKIEHHLALFHQILGLLELMQPKIFEDHYQDGLHAAFNCYFAFLRYHGHTKDCIPILYRLVDLLQAYTTANANKALAFIEQYADLLQEIASNNRSFYGLNQLIQGLSLLKHKNTTFSSKTEFISEKEGNNIKDEDGHCAAAVILAPYTKPDMAPPHWGKLVNTLKHNPVEDVLNIFEEIESITYKKPQLIEDIFDKVLEYLFHSSSNIRSKAHGLLVRFLKHNPGNASYNMCILTNYIQCLTSDDTSIVVTALEVLTEVVLCLQEHASLILNAVFEIGISSRVSAFAPLRKCLLALKTQQAC